MLPRVRHKPDSVEEDHPSRRPTHRRGSAPRVRSTRTGHPKAPAYAVLLRSGFAVPPSLAAGAVGSYPTVSPLPDPLVLGPSAVSFLWHFPGIAPPGLAPSDLPAGVRTFLGSCAPVRPGGQLPRSSTSLAVARTSHRIVHNNSIPDGSVHAERAVAPHTEGKSYRAAFGPL